MDSSADDVLIDSGGPQTMCRLRVTAAGVPPDGPTAAKPGRPRQCSTTSAAEAQARVCRLGSKRCPRAA